MQDLNDLFYFSQVVDHGGFAAAERALHIPKSRLSRRVSELEERLGVRLIERSTRRFRVTDLGRSFHEQCRVALEAAARAESIVSASLKEPRGLVRFSCPTGLVELVTPLVAPFLQLYPRARLQIVPLDRPVNLVAERIDVALRVRVKLDTQATLTLRTLGHSRRVLIASPGLANTLPSQDIEALAALPTLSTSDDSEQVSWELEGPNGRSYTHQHTPRLGCSDFAAVRAAALAGLGVALLPDHACAAELRSGALVRILADWRAADGIVHVVFPSGKRLPPLVRAWIDHLAKSPLFPKR